MKRLLLLLFLLPLFTFGQAPTDDSTKLTAPPTVGSFSMSSLYYRGGNTSNGQVGYLNTITGKWAQLVTGYQFNHYTGTSTQAQITAVTSGYVPNTRLVSTTSPLLGGGNLGGNLSLSIQQANTSQAGYLSSSDWNTFNNKQSALGFTPEDKANKVTVLDSSNTNYGSTSAIKKQLGGTTIIFSAGASNPVTISSYQATYAATYGNYPKFIVFRKVSATIYTKIDGVAPVYNYTSGLLTSIQFYLDPVPDGKIIISN